MMHYPFTSKPVIKKKKKEKKIEPTTMCTFLETVPSPQKILGQVQKQVLLSQEMMGQDV
jgi:hypothetical protein